MSKCTSLTFLFASHAQSQSSLVLQAANMYVDKPGVVNQDWLQLLTAVLNPVVIIILIPIMDQLIFPFLRDFTPSTLKRIGIGWASLVLVSFISMLYEAVKYDQSHNEDKCMFNLHEGDSTSSLSLSFWLFLLPQFLLSVSFMLIKTSSKLTCSVCLHVCVCVCVKFFFICIERSKSL